MSKLDELRKLYEKLRPCKDCLKQRCVTDCKCKCHKLVDELNLL